MPTTTRSEMKNKPPPGKYLNRLPAELVDRICNYLRRDSILHLRATCRDLATKTAEQFGKGHWTESSFTLSRTGAKQFRNMTKHNNISTYIKTLSLIAHDAGSYSNRDQYDDYLLAKGFTGSSIAIASNRLPNLTALRFVHFEFEQSCTFFHNFAKKFHAEKLIKFDLSDCKLKDTDLAKIIRDHKSTLDTIVLDDVNLMGGMNDLARNMGRDFGIHEAKAYRTPWSPVFEALLELKAESCGISIDAPKQFGEEAAMLGEDYAEVTFYGCDIMLMPDDPYDTEGEGDLHQVITILRDKRWRKGLRRLSQIYDYPKYDPEREGTPFWMVEGESDEEM